MRQVEATKTVTLVTLLYIMFNIPAVCIMVITMLKAGVTEANDDDDPNLTLKVSEFMQTYVVALSVVVCISLNSAINPWVYFFRMKEFRKYMTEQFRKLATSVKYETQ